MSISSALNAARSGLEATSLRADTVATNVANASTDGYVRRSVLLSENLLGGESSGVLSDGVSRSRNESLTAQRRNASSELAHSGVLAENRTTLSQAFGDTAEGSGLVSQVAQFEDSLRLAALSPESETALQTVLASANSVVSEINKLQELAARLYASTDTAIERSIETVDTAIKNVETLNAKIAGIDRTTSGAAALFDERDRALDELSTYLVFETVPRDSGAIDIVTKEGVYLLHGNARQIEVSPSTTGPLPKAASLSVDGIELTPGAPTYSALSTGRLAALVSFRDEELHAFSSMVTAIGDDLAQRLGAPNVDPTLAPGNSGLFVSTPIPGSVLGASSLSLNPQADPEQGGLLSRLRDGMGATNPGPVGNGSILQAMADALGASEAVASGGLNGSFTSFELVSHAASVLGAARVSQTNSLNTAQAQFTALAETEQAQSGVNLDEQMQQLLLIEQAYAANARIIQAADEMLQRLIEF